MSGRTERVDEHLSIQLTEIIRSVPGVTGVFRAAPLVEAAADVIAAGLSLRSPDALVDIERAEGFATVRAHIATTVQDTAADVVRRVGETVKVAVEADGTIRTPMAVNIAVRVIEDR